MRGKATLRSALTALAISAFAFSGCDQVTNVLDGDQSDSNGGSGPTVESVSPAPSATGVYLDAAVKVTFSTDMAPRPTKAAWKLESENGAVSGSTSIAGDVFTFTPNEILVADTEYTVTIGTGAEDENGNALSQQFTANFTTTSDSQHPSVVSIEPTDTSAALPGASVMVKFSEPMRRNAVEKAFSLTSGPGSSVEGAFNWSNTEMTFTPSQALSYDTQYNIEISTAARDEVGRRLQSARSGTFTTVIATTEVQSFDKVDNYKFAISFSKPMDQESVENNYSFSNSEGDDISMTSISWNASSDRVTFDPGNLCFSGPFPLTFVLTTDAQGQDGEPLEGFYFKEIGDVAC
jgi:hypothetical protein